jgi:hypothetical protein
MAPEDTDTKPIDRRTFTRVLALDLFAVVAHSSLAQAVSPSMEAK